MRKTALWAVVILSAASAAAAREVPAATTAAVGDEKTLEGGFAGNFFCTECGRRNPPEADYCIYCGAKLEQRAKKQVPQAVPAPPWFGPSGGYVRSRGAVGLACSYSRPRFEARGGGRYYFPLGHYHVYEYSVGASFRLFILKSRQRPFVEIKSEYYYEKYYVYDPRRGVTGSDSNLYPGVLFGLAYNYDGRGSSFAGAAGYAALVDLPGGYVYNRYPFVLENVTFVNDWLGFWLKGDFPVPYFAALCDLSGGLAFAF